MRGLRRSLLLLVATAAACSQSSAPITASDAAPRSDAGAASSDASASSDTGSGPACDDAYALFTSQVIDDAMSGDTKAAGDLDGDGYPDLVVGGMAGSEDMVWWQYLPSTGGWQRHALADASVEFTTDMQLGDIDDDGDLDVVVPDGPSELLWLENPRPARAATVAGWARHVIGNFGGYIHDLEVADLDRDGKLDVVARKDRTVAYFQNTPSSFAAVTLPSTGNEGLGIGDLDVDGDIDVVVDGAWLQNPLPGGNPRTATWTSRRITPSFGAELTSAVGDVNGDGRPDVVIAAQHTKTKLAWYQGPADPRATAPWTEHVIDASAGSHKLNLADFDRDGRLDLQTALEGVDTLVFFNEGGGAFVRTELPSSGGHNLRVADLGNDGRDDIFGTYGYTGMPPVRVWMNDLAPCDNTAP